MPTMNAPPDGAAPRADGDALYLRTITEDVLGWANPEARLRKALSHDQFLLYAQRIAGIKPRLADEIALEVLLRLKEEEDNLLPPGGFFPVAEALGMLGEIDDWVLRKTVAWCAAGGEDNRAPMCCINLSADSLLDAEFPERVRAQLREHDLPGHRLCFELEELDVLAHTGAAQRLITTLRARGCKFALDNFGSVKVSFEHVRALPVDYLKVDGGMIQNILKNPGDLARVKAISLTCQRLGMRVIASSVETADILNKLREVGFDFAQGFGIARPAPLESLRAAPRSGS
jgi:EAL domain-containing protein (putative c-di-GMP-specific phosphodiesterase class I)